MVFVNRIKPYITPPMALESGGYAFAQLIRQHGWGTGTDAGKCVRDITSLIYDFTVRLQQCVRRKEEDD